MKWNGCSHINIVNAFKCFKNVQYTVGSMYIESFVAFESINSANVIAAIPFHMYIANYVYNL